MSKLKLGIALGAGAARGWAHIGVIKALCEAGLTPDIVCGSSIGALVSASYAAGTLAELEDWLLGLGKLDVVRLFDPSWRGGGFITGDKLMAALQPFIGGRDIGDLALPYAAVASELYTGREIWLREGPLDQAVRASIALPGLFTPVARDGLWLLDGGLVNPVPVSLCRAMGADIVIAVSVNKEGLPLRPAQSQESQPAGPPNEEIEVQSLWNKLTQNLSSSQRDDAERMVFGGRRKSGQAPGLFDVIIKAIDIMQVRITRSRLAGDPPDLLLSPGISDIQLMEFYRAGEAIRAGEISVLNATRELNNLIYKYQWIK